MRSPEGRHGAAGESPQGAVGPMIQQLLQEASLIVCSRRVQAALRQPWHH